MNIDVRDNMFAAEAADPILRLQMPGCFVSGANRSALEYFKRHAKIDLAQSIDAYIGTVLQGPGILLDGHCAFEQAYVWRSNSEPWGPALVAFHFGDANGKRHYRLFVAHALSTEAHELVVRLVPLPEAAFELVLEDLPDHTGAGAYTPRSAIVADTLFKCNAQDCERFTRTQEVYAKLVAAERPATALAELDEEDRQLPAHVLQLLTRSTESSLIRQTLRRALAHPLDAPLLAEVLPTVWMKIREDRDLRYLPTDENEQLEYLRARLPLRELEQQDRYLGWLALPDDWDHEQSRAELYQS